MKATIVIDNYNYDRFLAEAIDSALAQTYPHTEVVVVDDGSTDRSRDIIGRYGSRVRPIFKPNGGQASALNAGFQASQGDIVFFLDSDDTLAPNAVRNAVEAFRDPDVVKAHWRLRVVDENGRPTGRYQPGSCLPHGNLRDRVLQGGPTHCVSSPTSGNAWRRAFLNRVMPIPESVDYYKTCADEYLYTLAPLFGTIAALSQPQGTYRLHAASIYTARSPAEKLELELSGHEQQCQALQSTLARHGVPVDLAAWRRKSWFHRLKRSLDELQTQVPAGASILLVDGDTWNARDLLPRHRVLPFLERDGAYWGPPPDSHSAIQEVEAARAKGVEYLALAWPAFWWLQTYRDFARHLRENFTAHIENERLILFELRPRREPRVTQPERSPRFSIVINNYNYAPFVGQAIESALRQTCPDKEVIVVDDGSTDESRKVIAAFGNRIHAIYQGNGGQGATYNTGFHACRGQWICYLDADDTLLPNALDSLAPLLAQPDVVKIQWRLKVIDKQGNLTGAVIPPQNPPEGDLRDQIVRDGPIYDWNFTPPGSANLWSRRFLSKVLPMPEPPYKNGADVFLITVAPAFGRVLTAANPLGCYRIHGRNNYTGRPLDDERVRNYIERFETNCRLLQHHLGLQGVEPNTGQWRSRNFNHVWPTRLLHARNTIRNLIPPGKRYILVNDNEWGLGEPVPGRHAVPFLERDGQYWGQPANDQVAIEELTRLHRLGADYIAFWWTSFWWLDHYALFHQHLRAHAECLADDDSLVLFRLPPASQAAHRAAARPQLVPAAEKS